MPWLTYTTVDDRWPSYENFSPYPSVAASAQAWVGKLITDSQAELETLIPQEFADSAAASPTPAALVSAGYILTRAKVMEWFFTTKGHGSIEEVETLQERAERIVQNWVDLMRSQEERGGVRMARTVRKDPFWQFSEDEDVGADYEL